MAEKCIPVDKELCSTLSFGTYSFPAEIFYDDLDEYANNFVNWHKQREVEISQILEGEAEVQVLEKKRPRPGDTPHLSDSKASALLPASQGIRLAQ